MKNLGCVGSFHTKRQIIKSVRLSVFLRSYRKIRVLLGLYLLCKGSKDGHTYESLTNMYVPQEPYLSLVRLYTSVTIFDKLWTTYWSELFFFFNYLDQIGHPDRPSVFNSSVFTAAESIVASTFEMSNIGGDETSPQQLIIKPQPKAHSMSTSMIINGGV